MNQAPETRASLLVRLRDQRDGAAWSEFVEIYEPLVYALVCKRGLQDADALEITQDVMLAVSARIDDWDPDRSRGSFRAWLACVARNLVVNFLVRQRRQTRGSGDSRVQQVLDQWPAPVGDESALFDREHQRRLFAWASQQVRDEFQQRTWQAFWRTCVQGGDVRLVASDLGLSVGAVYVARSRVMARLKQKIQPFRTEP